MKYLDNSGLAKVIEKLRNEIKANSNEKIIIGKAFSSLADGQVKTMQELADAFFGDTTHTPQELIDTLKRIWNEGIPAYFQNNDTLVHRNYPVTIMHLNPTKYYFIYFDGNSGSIRNIYISYLSADATATTTISKKTMDIRVNDNLTSTSTTTPLSANQGKVLNDKIEAMKPINSLISDSTEASLAAAAGKTLNDKIEEQKPVYFPMEFWVSKDNMTGQEMVNLFYGDETHTIEQFRNELLRAKSTEKNNVPVFVYQKNTASQRTIAPVSFLGGRRSTSLGSIQYLIYTDNNGIHISSFTIPSTAEETCWISAGSYDYRAIDNLTSTSTTQGLSANQGRILNEKIENLPYEKIISEEYTATTNSNFVWDETNKDYTTTYPESTTGNYDSSLVIKPNKSVSKLIIDITSNLQSTALVSIIKGTETLKETLTSEQLVIENLTSSDSIDITVRMTTAGESFKVKMTTIEEDLNTDKFLSVVKQTEPFIPTEEWQPTTKKYVDERNMETFLVNDEFFLLGNGTMTCTCEEYGQKFFGDTVHTYQDFIDAIEKVRTGKANLYFADGGRIYPISFNCSYMKVAGGYFMNVNMSCTSSSGILYYNRLTNIWWTKPTNNITNNYSSTNLDKEVYIGDTDESEIYTDIYVKHYPNLYSDKNSILLKDTYFNGSLLSYKKDNKVLLIKVLPNKTYSFTSQYMVTNKTNPFNIKNVNSNFQLTTLGTSTMSGDDYEARYFTTSSDAAYVAFHFTSDEMIEKFRITTGSSGIRPTEKAVVPVLKVRGDSTGYQEILDIEVSNSEPANKKCWIKKGLVNLFDKSIVQDGKKQSGSNLVNNANIFTFKITLEPGNIYYLKSKYATFETFAYKGESQSSILGNYTGFSESIIPEEKTDYYFNFTKDSTHTLEEQLDNIILSKNMNPNDYAEETEICFKNDKGEYYSAANLSKLQKLENINNSSKTQVFSWDGTSSSSNSANLALWQEIYDASREDSVVVVPTYSNSNNRGNLVFGVNSYTLKPNTSNSIRTPLVSIGFQGGQTTGNYNVFYYYYVTVQVDSNGNVTSVGSMSSSSVSTDSFLSTRANPGANEFVPTLDYHPATKKYVDDKTPIDFNKVYTMTWSNEDSGYTMPIEGLTSLEQIRDRRIPFIAEVMGTYVGTSYGLSLTNQVQTGTTANITGLYAPFDTESITLGLPGGINYITFTNKNGKDCFVIDNDRKDLTLNLSFMTSTTTSYETIDSLVSALGVKDALTLGMFLSAMQYRPIPVTFKGRLSTTDGYSSFTGSMSGFVAVASGVIKTLEFTTYAHTKIYNVKITKNTDNSYTAVRKVIDLAELAGVLGGSY